MLIATHNIMDGLRVGELTATYRRLAARGLSVLCVQEDRAASRSFPGDAIAAALGPRWRLDRGGDGLTVLTDPDQVSVDRHEVIALPRLERLSWLERRYIRGGAPERKFAQRLELRGEDGAVTVINFHLDTAGDNAHRARQVDTIAAAIEGIRFVACGDTNVFTVRQREHRAALARVTRSLTALGAIDPETRPTHFFARQGEPSAAHRLAALVGRIGLDLPRRYDVVCGNLPALARGHAHTPASDHDLVWARFFLGG